MLSTRLVEIGSTSCLLMSIEAADVVCWARCLQIAAMNIKDHDMVLERTSGSGIDSYKIHVQMQDPL